MAIDYDKDTTGLYEEDEILGVDEEIKRNHEDLEFQEFSSESDDDSNEDSVILLVGKSLDSLRAILRDELYRSEYNRRWHKFEYRGKKYTGKVLHEIEPNKFIFLVDDGMKGIWINEVAML